MLTVVCLRASAACVLQSVRCVSLGPAIGQQQLLACGQSCLRCLHSSAMTEQEAALHIILQAGPATPTHPA